MIIIAMMMPAIAPVAIPRLRLEGEGGLGVTVSSVYQGQRNKDDYKRGKL